MRTVQREFKSATLQVTWLETKFLNLILHTNLGCYETIFCDTYKCGREPTHSNDCDSFPKDVRHSCAIGCFIASEKHRVSLAVCYLNLYHFSNQ